MAQRLKVTVTTEDGELLEQYTTDPIPEYSNRGAIIRGALADAAALQEVGLNSWE